MDVSFIVLQFYIDKISYRENNQTLKIDGIHVQLFQVFDTVSATDRQTDRHAEGRAEEA